MSFYERALPEGHSGYFSAPSDHLDPHLFDGEHLRDEVRQHLLVVLQDGLMKFLDLHGVNEWLEAWITGSGITYQWDGDRGAIGDLDVLFGVDMRRFVHHNPDYQGITEADLANYTDMVLRQKLWPLTAHTQFNGRAYEATFYWNPGTGTDIRRIKPYAAYDLKRNVWVVRPPQIADDPHAAFPAEWYQAARPDVDAADALVSRHRSATQAMGSTSPSEQVNGLAAKRQVEREARALFDSIHLGRHAAFGEQGHGYGDYANFRWQHAKQQGVVEGLSPILDTQQLTDDMTGAPLDAANTLLTRDAIRYGRGR